MIDICIPAHISPEPLYRCLKAYHENTQVKHRFVVFNDGWGGELTSAALGWAADHPKVDFVLLRSKNRIYFTQAMNECLRHTKFRFHAVVDPRMTPIQRGWEGMMLHPLMIDQQAAVAFANPHSMWSRNPPSVIHKRDRADGLKKGLFVLSKWKSANVDRNVNDPVPDLLDEVYAKGKRAWIVPSVRVIWEEDSTYQDQEPEKRPQKQSPVELILSR